MRSIRVSLLVGSLVGTLGLLFVVSAVLYRGAAAILERQLDESLADRARTFAAVVKKTPEGIEFEQEDVDMPEFTTEEGRGYLELWVEGDSVLYRSPNLRGHDLAPVASGAIDHPEFRWTRTPKHTRMRVVDLHTHAVVDPEDWDEVGEPAPPAPPIRFVAAIEATDVDAFLSRLRRLISILGAASGLLLSVILGVVVRRSLRPLDDLAGEIGKLSGTDLSTRVRLKSTPKEMVPVVDQLNQLLARLDEAFERERTFSADIAHELRTPLAGLRSTVDVAMSRPRDESASRETFAELLAIIRRLQNMVETLLYLGRLESGHVNIERVGVDLGEFTGMTWQSFEDAARHSLLTVIRELPPGIVVMADPVLLEVAVRNLLDNAISYTDQGGTVRLETLHNGTHGVLRVSNTGSKAAAEVVDELTRRFTRLDPARHTSGEHFGLGLALVSRIADALDGTLEISSTEGGEFVATLSLRR